MGPTPAPPQLQVDSIHSAPGVHSSRHCSQGSVCQYSTGCGHSVCSTHQEGFPRQSMHWVSSAVQGELCFTRCRSFLNLTRHPLPYRLRAHGQMQSSKLWMGHRPVSRASPRGHLAHPHLVEPAGPAHGTLQSYCVAAS